MTNGLKRRMKNQQDILLTHVTSQDTEHSTPLHHIHNRARAGTTHEGYAERRTEQSVNGVDRLRSKPTARTGNDGSATWDRYEFLGDPRIGLGKCRVERLGPSRLRRN